MVGNFFYGWLILALIFLLFEISNLGLFFFFSFFIGALSAAFATFLTDNIAIQSLLFLMISALSCFVFPAFLKKRMRQIGQPTNVQALIGKRAIVIKSIMQEEAGQVKVRGEIWSAWSINNQIIEKDETVEVVAIQGVHLFVKKV